MSWFTDNALALLVAAGSVVAWLYTNWRVGRSEIRFRIEADAAMPTFFKLRNVGTRRIEHQGIDPASVAKYGMESNAVGPRGLDPEEAATFILHPDQQGQYPDAVRVQFRVRLTGRIRSVAVRFPTAADTESSSGDHRP